MINPKDINEWVQQIMDRLPPSLQNLPKNFQAGLHAALMSTFEQLDLVTREEFDAQIGVLLKTRVKLEQLESRLRELEQQLRELEQKKPQDL